MDAQWINPSLYPFKPHTFHVSAGEMHYVDEGQGPPVVMVHGTPTWSFLYRHLIRGLSTGYRAIAPDHIGFGLSDKPDFWSYKPSDHAQNLCHLIEAFELKNLTLVVHDFGGPIGLSYAVEHPENVSAIVLFNTFMWSLKGDPAFERPARLFNNALGKFAYKNLNFSAAFMIRATWGDKRKLTREIHRHYLQALPTPADRQGTWVFMQELIGSGSWYGGLWAQRERLQDIPVLILWGMRDIAFREKELERWEKLFTHAQVLRFAQAGHFVQEEEGEELVPVVREFLDGVYVGQPQGAG